MYSDCGYLHNPACCLPLQAVCSSVTVAHSREVQWKASELLVVQLQARAQGFLLRQKLSERLHFLNTQLPAIVTIQVRKHQMLPPIYSQLLTKMALGSVSF